MNRDFEFKQLLRAYRAGIISEETFESEMGAMEHGNGNGNGTRAFQAMGKSFSSERSAVDAMLDRFRAGEANGEVAFAAWSKLCTTDCIRSGIRMIAEREGYHARIFERRMRDLGLECKAPVTEASRKITEYLADPNVTDNQKLLYLNSLAPDIDSFFKPITDLAENIKDDLESKELFKLYVQDELSSARWLQYACEALNGAGTPATQSMPAQSGAADSIV
ncbi:MAG TPA: hypothetical protein VHS07_01645 [Candidatus Binataceae bacterium]|jgi:hypothetical protein|nr:hypothetical protein [Candidatus Binataceae bacterium]